MMEIGKFFGELKRRNVYKIAVAYLVGGWALAQGLAQVLPVFSVPNWVIQVLVVLIAIGLPVALGLAWAFELTPERIKRGEKDKAFEWLQISFDNHDTGTLTFLTDPLLRGLRDDARYKKFLVKLGLPTTS